MTGQSPGPRRWTWRTSPRKTRRSTVAGNRFEPGGTIGPSVSASGRIETVTGVPVGESAPARALADQPAERGADDDLAPRVGPLDLPLEQVGRAEEPGDEGVGRAVVDLVRRPDLDDPAQVHHRQAVGQRQRLARVVGQDQGGHLGLGVDAADLVAELVAGPGLEPAERLVEDQQLGPAGQGARQRHPLALRGRRAASGCFSARLSIRRGPAPRRPGRAARRGRVPGPSGA